MMTCPDTAFDHFQCGLQSSANSYRFADAEQHFQRAISLAQTEEPGFTLASALVSYAHLLLRMGRPQEAVAQMERRLSLPKFLNEDRLERRCTMAQLAELKAELAAAARPAM